MIFGKGDYRTNRIKHVKNMVHGKAGNHGDYGQNHINPYLANVENKVSS